MIKQLSVLAWVPLAVAAMPAPALSDPLTEARAAYLAAWSTAPLSVARAVFAKAPASAYGMVEERGSNVFVSGEPIYIYFEPLGYGWKPDGGQNVFGLDVGLRVLSDTGGELFQDQDFLELAARSNSQPTEFYGNITLNLTGIQSGAYTLEFLLGDIASDETVTATMPIKVK
jgi:hypothetical protein